MKILILLDDGVEIQLSVSQARELYGELNMIFDKQDDGLWRIPPAYPYPYPYPYPQPYNPWVWTDRGEHFWDPNSAPSYELSYPSSAPSYGVNYVPSIFSHRSS